MNEVLHSIVLVAIQAGKVNDANDLGVAVFQFIDRDVSVRRLAVALDGSSCFSVSAVVDGNLTPCARLWIDAGRNLGVVVPDPLPSELENWFVEALEVMKGDENE